MKPHLKELITDLKAAARIGHPEALKAGLDRLRRLSDADLPPTALVPLGQALASLPASRLRAMLKDSDPAIRAIAGVALGERYLTQADVAAAALLPVVSDPNPEVGNALANCLRSLGENPKTGSVYALKLGVLVTPWLQAAEPGVVIAGLKIFPSCRPTAASIADMLGPLHVSVDQQLRAALVECLNTLASAGQAQVVLDLMDEWAHLPQPNVWIITHCLSGTWAQEYAQRAAEILNSLIEQAGLVRPIVRALARLHGQPVVDEAD